MANTMIREKYRDTREIRIGRYQKYQYPNNLIYTIMNDINEIDDAMKHRLYNILDEVNPKIKQYISYKFKYHYTNQKIAELEGVSVTRVSQYLLFSIRYFRRGYYMHYLLHGDIDNSNRDDILSLDVAAMTNDTRTYHALIRSNINTVNDLVQRINNNKGKEPWYHDIHHLGEKSANDLLKWLDDHDIHVVDKYTKKRPFISEEDTPEFIGSTIDVIEDFLYSVGIRELGDEHDPDNEALIYGKQYDVLADKLREMFSSWNIIKGEDNA